MLLHQHNAQVNRTNKILLLCFFLLFFSISLWTLYQVFHWKPCFPFQNSIRIRDIFKYTVSNKKLFMAVDMSLKEWSFWVVISQCVFHRYAFQLNFSSHAPLPRCVHKEQTKIEIVSTDPMWNDFIDLTNEYFVCMIITPLWCNAKQIFNA